MTEPDTDLPLEVEKTAPATTGGAAARIKQALFAFRFIPLGIALVLIGGVIGLYFQPPGLQKAFEVTGLEPGAGSSDPLAVRAPQRQPTPEVQPTPAMVVGLGNLLPVGDVITVAPPFGAGDARIASLRVEEGDTVEAGQVLATLDSLPDLEAALETSRATLAVREATLTQVRSATTAARAEAEAALAAAQATARNAAQELARAEELQRRGVVSAALLDQRRAAREESARAVDQARATLSRYQGDSIEQQPDVLVAARNVDAARADLARATRDLARGEIRAPSDGTVLTLHAREGEKPGSEGLLTLGNLSEMKAEIEIYQTLVSDISVGAPVTLKAEALPQPLQGTVSRIGLEVQRQSRIDDDPAANTDARVVKVTVALEEASSKLAARFTNLQVTAHVQRNSPAASASPATPAGAP